MSIFVRIWLAFSVVLIVGSAMTIQSLQQEIKPSMRQVVEDTLAENAQLIANIIADDVQTGQIAQPAFNQRIHQLLTAYHQQQANHLQQTKTAQQLYITNAQGIVIYDSRQLAIGQDYSQWNDVYLTLRGKYGARSTRSNPKDERTSVMYVAAPIMHQGHLIGVLTLIKPSQSVQQFIDQTHQQMLIQGLGFAALSLLLSAGVAWWIRASIYKVRQHALALGDSRNIAPPHFKLARELNELSQAISNMHQQLENRAYVENYVHTLTHELKSPLTAITACAELLEEPLSEPDRIRFSQNIQQQSLKLQHLVERLLLLAKLENNAEQLMLKPILLEPLVAQAFTERTALIAQQQLHIEVDINPTQSILADSFWLAQLLANLLDNAMAYTPAQGYISIKVLEHNTPLTGKQVELQVFNQGAAIPDYALAKVFDRYFSLPSRISQAKHIKGTGIGLTLVKEIMQQHYGKVSIENKEDGVLLRCWFKCD